VSLSIRFDNIPDDTVNLGLRTHQSIRIDGEEIEFSGGFTDLHIKSYELILVERDSE